MKQELSKAMQSKAGEIAKAAELAAAHISDWQQIKAFFKNRLADIELSPQQQEKLKRYNTIYSELQGNNYTDIELPGMISKLFNISLPTAYKEIAATKELYSRVIHLDKLFEIRLCIEQCKIMLHKSEESGDMAAWAVIDRNRQKYVAMLPEEESKMEENYQVPQIIAMFNPELLGMPAEFNMKELLDKINAKRDAKINTELFDEVEIITDEPSATS